MCINDMNVAASKKHVAEAEVLVAIADDSNPVARQCRPGNHCSHATFGKMFVNNR